MSEPYGVYARSPPIVQASLLSSHSPGEDGGAIRGAEGGMPSHGGRGKCAHHGTCPTDPENFSLYAAQVLRADP